MNAKDKLLTVIEELNEKQLEFLYTLAINLFGLAKEKKQ